MEDCSSRVPVPKLHVYADHHYSAINGVARGADGRLHFRPWKIFLTPDLVVTVLGPTHTALSAEAARRELVSVRDRLDAGTLRPASAFEIVSALGFEMLRAQEYMIGTAASGIARLEQRVMETDPVRAEALLQTSSRSGTTCRRSARTRRRPRSRTSICCRCSIRGMA